MSERIKSILIRYGIAAGIGGLMTYLTLVLHGYGELETAVDRYRLLCDAFTIPGVILFMVGILVWIAGKGMFDSLAYLGRSFFWLFNGAKPVRYYDFVQEKRAKRKKGGYGFLLLTGGVFLLVALVFLFLFYRIY